MALPRDRHTFARLHNDPDELDDISGSLDHFHRDPVSPIHQQHPSHPPVDRPLSETLYDDYRAISRGLGLDGSDSSTTQTEQPPRETSQLQQPLSDSSFTSARHPNIRRISLNRVPVGSRSAQPAQPIPLAAIVASPELKGPADPLLTPPVGPARATPQQQSEEWGHNGNHTSKLGGISHTRERSQASLHNGRAASLRSGYESDDQILAKGTAVRSVGHTHGHSAWLAFGIVFSSVFSTAFSGVFLVIALKAPRYSSFIGTNGTMTPGNAVILTAVVAKLVELTFATACVAFLGQVLSRRVINHAESRGVTLAEMTMRNWIMQPGSVLTHWEGVRYAGLTLLGALSLVSAIMATLYTSAATALVQPQLRFGNWEQRMIAGTVKAKFSNPTFLADECQTPIVSRDPTEGTTCLQIEHASTGYHNYRRYLAQWSTIATSGNGSSDLRSRPPGVALLYDNTTVTGPWIDIVPLSESSKRAGGRVVNNVTMAMPHAGVIGAARNKRNEILQPEDLDGLGVYSLRAAVASPAINVLCVNMNRTELEPLVWHQWQGNTTFNITDWKASHRSTDNVTVVDELFGWGNTSEGLQHRPVFPKLPIAYNTVTNHSAPWGVQSIYILGRAAVEETYVVCSLKVFQTPDCSTRYSASQSGSTLNAVCTSPVDSMAHSRFNETAVRNEVDLDWPNIASEASNSWSLSAGISDGAASNARLLTQLILPSPPPATDRNSDSPLPDLDPALPSVAEALAVLFGGTLLMSTIATPFTTGKWNYTGSLPVLGAPYATQYFHAAIRSQQYASGAADGRSRGWYVALFLVFIINLVILVYFIFHRGTLVTDFSEPPNLFSLAVNSPPSSTMHGAQDKGPKGQQYNVPWLVQKKGEHLLLEPRTPGIRKSVIDVGGIEEEGGVRVVGPGGNTPNTPGSAGFKGFKGSLLSRGAWGNGNPRASTAQLESGNGLMGSGNEGENGLRGNGGYLKSVPKMWNRRSTMI